MKKTILVLIIVLLVLAIAVGCAALYFLNSPQYALLCILKDVKAEGMEGLAPHLTGDAMEMMEKVTSASQNPLLSTLLSLLIPEKYMDVAKSELQNVTWNVEDVMKSRKRAQVMLSFDYEGEITGTINLSMIRTDDGWKIDGVNSPKIDGFSFEDIQLPDFKDFFFKESSEDPSADSFRFEDIELPKFEDFSFEDIDLPNFKNFPWKGSKASA